MVVQCYKASLGEASRMGQQSLFVILNDSLLVSVVPRGINVASGSDSGATRRVEGND
jgi:hypothetical protein